MAKVPPETVRKLPFWVPLAGSAAITFHLVAVSFLALAAPSGPWPVYYGVDMSPGPQFANVINNFTMPLYLQPLGMTHNYHFLTNRTAHDGIGFEIVLRDQNGQELQRLKFPETNANFWVRHRQHLLAQGLGNDNPVPPRAPQKVGATGEAVQKVDFWLNYMELKEIETKELEAREEEIKGLKELGLAAPDLNAIESQLVPAYLFDRFPKTFKPKTSAYVRFSISEVQEGSVPRNRPLAEPSPWAMLLAKSYLRHLCDRHNAHTAELIRHSRPAVFPAYMFMREPPEDAFTEMIANFGDLKRDFEEVQK